MIIRKGTKQDIPAITAIYDRILERCVPIRINNRNIRQDNATDNLKRAKKILLNNHAPNQN